MGVVMKNFVEKNWVSLLRVGPVVWGALHYFVGEISFYRLIETAVCVVFPPYMLLFVIVLYTKKIKP
jgi:hypothetical protein